MFRWFRDALNWAQALDQYSRQNFRQAVAKLEAIEGARNTFSEYLALLGTAYIALEMPDTGKALMMQAKERSSPRKESYRPYIKAYCAYYISVVDGDPAAAELYLKEALRVSVPPIIRQWLPLS